jgi:hypothetical protein
MVATFSYFFEACVTFYRRKRILLMRVYFGCGGCFVIVRTKADRVCRSPRNCVPSVMMHVQPILPYMHKVPVKLLNCCSQVDYICIANPREPMPDERVPHNHSPEGPPTATKREQVSHQQVSMMTLPPFCTSAAISVLFVPSPLAYKCCLQV